MNKSKQIKMGIVLSQMGLAANTLVGVIYTPVMLRLLGQSEFGLYTLIVSTVNYLNLLSLGFTSSYLRFFCRFKASDEEKHRVAELNGMYMMIFTAMGIVALIVGSLLVVNIHSIFGGGLTETEYEKARILMILMVILVAQKFPMSVFETYLTANERFVVVKTISLLQRLLYPVLVIVVLEVGFKSIGMTAVSLGVTLLMEIIILYYAVARLHMAFNFKKFDLNLMKELSTFSSFVFINMIVVQINLNLDKFLLGRMIGTTAVAVYGIAAKLNVYYKSIPMSVSSVLTPKVNQMIARKEDMFVVTKFITKIGRLQLYVIAYIGIAYVVFGKVFIEVCAGKAYEEAYYVFLILIVSMSLTSIQNLCFEVQKAMNRLKIRSILQLIAAVLNVMVSIPLIRLYGPTGAVIGTAFATVIVNLVIMNIYYQRGLGLDMNYFWLEVGKTLPAMIIPSLFAAWIYFNISLYSVVNFIGYAVVYSLVFGACIYMFAMNVNEKQLIVQPLNKMISRFSLSKE